MYSLASYFATATTLLLQKIGKEIFKSGMKYGQGRKEAN
jgi:hypothetical protein